MIRITGGKYSSRLLLTPSTNLTKPTMDKVRAAVFSSLQNEFLGNVLDLFAGSGSYGFEALSRGAIHVDFVDKEPNAVKTIKENAQKLNETNYSLFLDDALNFLKTTYHKYNIIFVDPPYKLDIYRDIVKIVIEKNILKNDGILVLETDDELNFDFSNFRFIKYKKYGLAKIYILKE